MMNLNGMEMKFDKIESVDIDIARIAKICIEEALDNLEYSIFEDPKYYGLPDFYNGEYSDPAKCIETVIDEVAKYLDKYVNEI